MSNIVHLRKLKSSDAHLMLEWMHDDDVVHFMKADFEHKMLSDCEAFIASAHDSSHNLHLAVVDDSDTYMGTVSLKDITTSSAEFAITMRKAAMGKGYAAEAMKEIINKGFVDLGLQFIYWCVNKDNHRAVRFYDKNGYARVSLGQLSEALNTTKSDIITGGGTAERRLRTSSGTWLSMLLLRDARNKKLSTRRAETNPTRKTEYGSSFCFESKRIGEEG